MKKRLYKGKSDLTLLQDFNASAISQTDGCGFLHPGDIPHHIYNGNKFYDPAEIMSIWEDRKGIAAWLLIEPRHKSFDAQVRPDLRGGLPERNILEYAERRTIELIRHYGIEGDRISGDAFRDDSARSSLLLELGWKKDNEPPYIQMRTVLSEIPDPVLPEGYMIRCVRDTEESAALAEIHSASFGSKWTAEQYSRVMESPGYNPERELIIEAPDGSFAAFTVTWYDTKNLIGLFEPVGTHKDYRRLGLGRALIYFGMNRMINAGMRTASVAAFGTNIASKALYKRCGFTTWHEIDSYSKKINI